MMKLKGFTLLGLLVCFVVFLLLLLILNNNAAFNSSRGKNSVYKDRQEQINTKVEELQRQIDYSREQNNIIQGNY